jgi:hypothetical protein
VTPKRPLGQKLSLKGHVSDFVARATGRIPSKRVRADISGSLDTPTCGGIYFIQTGSSEVGPVKIGMAANIRSRLRDLQTGHPRGLRLLWYERIDDESARIARECELHQKFQDIRMRGEWFNVSIIERMKELAIGRTL